MKRQDAKAAPDIKILVVNHKPSFNVRNGILKTIQVGTALASQTLPDMDYFDNTGDNISAKNRSYCELTATYWMWKNLDADYYGLWHYRRYLSFADHQENDLRAGRAYPNIAAALPDIGLDETKMRRLIAQYDLVIPRQEDTRNYGRSDTIYDQYKTDHFARDLDDCLAYAAQKYPDIAPFSEVLNRHAGYFCNMLIARKAIFQQYCEFLFDVLGQFDKTHDITNYSLQQYRVDGYLAERLTNIFIHYLQSLGQYKICELQTAYFEDTEPLPTIQPVACANNIAVALAADNFYAPYVSTLLHSIVRHINPADTYDINIFNRDFTPDSQRLLREEFQDFANVSLRFCDMRAYAEQYEHLFAKWHISAETYFRLFIPDIMADYDKVLYLDVDMIVRRDIAELFRENVDGKILAAVRDVDMAGVYNSNLSAPSDNTFDKKRRDYLENKLQLKKPFDYFQAGVILFNLREMRRSFSVQDALDFAAQKWEFQDQDVLNYLAQGKVKFLDWRWNVQYDWEFWRIRNVIAKAPIQMYLDYMESRQNPYIIHYSGTVKPWQRADCDFATEYWRAARASVFYGQIIARMSDWQIGRKTAKAYERINYERKLRPKISRKLRAVGDKLAPVGSRRRKPLTLVSHAVKKILR